ncbi:MAG: 2-succinyl-5-enolpyruvyl-6-hydroxy-3-cyclohexene-carboxylate synthase, partial [Subtercola sp.]|nr:2-succinyl-5-enolpyruvyl-6-hydroxy-3-cyclohexene-carboxylate synthase [Subtercola sp.]
MSAAAGPAGSPPSSPAADFSLAVLGELVALGVTDAVLTPGSRSQALALTLAELHRARMLDLQVRIDERVAGFTALGLGAETGRPAIVVTTSGTAVANLLPAVLEAHHSRIPMLLITSDRPSSMRGTAGNQTTWQPGIFGRFVRLALDVPAPSGDPGEPALAARLAAEVVAAALGTRTGNPGPVHLNLQLREPLSGSVPDLVALLA